MSVSLPACLPAKDQSVIGKRCACCLQLIARVEVVTGDGQRLIRRVVVLQPPMQHRGCPKFFERLRMLHAIDNGGQGQGKLVVQRFKCVVNGLVQSAHLPQPGVASSDLPRCLLVYGASREVGNRKEAMMHHDHGLSMSSCLI